MFPAVRSVSEQPSVQTEHWTHVLGKLAGVRTLVRLTSSDRSLRSDRVSPELPALVFTMEGGLLSGCVRVSLEHPSAYTPPTGPLVLEVMVPSTSLVIYWGPHVRLLG